MTARANFFIVGAPKSGTTAMYEYLKAHPDIYMSEEKEPQFFCTDLHFAPAFGQVVDLDSYLKLFAGWQGESRVGEASVWYLYSKTAAREIRQYDPHARIIIMLRNPVEMVYASYYESRFNGTEDLPSFREAWDAEASRKQGHRIPRTAVLVEALYYRDIARYTEMVRRYLDVFGQEQVHIIIFDDFKSDPARAYKKTLEFLEVDPTFEPEFRIINANKVTRSHWVRNLFRYPPAWFMTPRRLFRQYVPLAARHRINRTIRALNTTQLPREPLDESLRQELVDNYREEIAQLSLLLKRDLSHWTV